MTIVILELIKQLTPIAFTFICLFSLVRFAVPFTASHVKEIITHAYTIKAFFSLHKNGVDTQNGKTWRTQTDKAGDP